MRTHASVVRRLALVAASLAIGLVACGDDGGASQPGVDAGVDTDSTPDAVDACTGEDCVAVSAPLWASGDTWWVAALYRDGQAKLPEWAASLSGAPALDAAAGLTPPSGWAPAEDESWGSPVVWEFEVVGAGVAPIDDSPLAAYAATARGTQTVSILRVTAPVTLNRPDIVEGLDPTFYVIVGDIDRRARAVHFDYRVAGGRNTIVLELPDGEQAEALGANYDMFVVPFLMPAFPLERGDYTTVVGRGTVLDEMTVSGADGAASVSFRTQPDGRVVRQQWTDGAPWFDVSATPDRIAWMIEPADVPEGLGDRGADQKDNLETPQTIEEKFRRPIRLDDAFDIAAGRFESRAPDSHLPWAGYWWPLSDAPTAFGWSRGDRQQHSDSPSMELRNLVRADFETLDRLGEELRELDREDETYDAKRTEYFEVRDRVRETVWTFTSDPENGLAARFSRGEFDLGNVDDFSPLVKWGLYLMTNKLSVHPFEGLAWEVIRQYNPIGGSWWGKCNGWSAAAILAEEPREALTLQLPRAGLGQAEGSGDTIDLVFETGDIKALASGVYYSTMSHFYGARYNDEEDDLADLHPQAFHRLITYYIGEEKFPLVFDTTADAPVWNYPAYGYTMNITDAGEVDAGTASINAVTRDELLAVDGVDELAADAVLLRRRTEGRIEVMSALESLDGVSETAYAALSAAFSSDGARNAFDVRTELRFSTDSVSEDHVDGEGALPEGFTNVYTYRLYVDAGGRVVDGDWTGESVEKHPDFAWLPYTNNRRRAADLDRYDAAALRRAFYDGRNAPSENPFLFTDVMDRILVVRANAPVVCHTEPDDCPAGFACNGVDGTCEQVETPTTCAGGEERSAAVALDAGRSDGNAVCAGRDSWFALAVEEGGGVRVAVYFEHDDGDIDLELLGPAGDVVGTSTSIEDVEEVSATALAAGTYLARVYGYNGAANAVGIEVEYKAPEGGGGDACGDAAIEPNDSLAEAAPLTADGVSAEICAAGDVDVYAIPAEAGVVTVTLSFTHADGDLDLLVRDADGNVASRSAGTDDTEAVEANGGQFVEVYGYRDASGLYALDY